MSNVELVVLAATGGSNGTPAPAASASQGTASPSATPSVVNSISLPGVVKSTWLDGWTWCKASSKLLARHTWVPWLSAAASVISAITATAIFANIQQNESSTWSRAVVGAVAASTAAITAVQGWTAARIKTLNDQVVAFHKFHRKLQQDVEDARVIIDKDYATAVEEELRGVMASTITVSNRDWNKARREVLKEAKLVTIPKHASSA